MRKDVKARCRKQIVAGLLALCMVATGPCYTEAFAADGSGTSAEDARWEEVSGFLRDMVGVYTKPNHELMHNWEDQQSTPNGPIMGNGDMHVVLVGTEEEQEFSISESDMWTEESEGKNVRAVTTGPVIRGRQSQVPSGAGYAEC